MSKETNSAEVLLNQNVAPEQFDWDSFESGLDADARKEKNDLEKLNKTISNFLNVESNFGKVLEDKTKELARSQANTVNQTNNLPAQTAKVPKGQRPLPPSGANASS